MREDPLTSTSELVRRVVRDPAAGPIEELLTRAGDRILTLLSLRMSARLKCRMEPEDVLQEVYIQALRLLESFEDRGKGSFHAWFTTVALHHVGTLERMVSAAKRDPFREVAGWTGRGPDTDGDAIVDRLAGDGSTPSARAMRWEQFERVRRLLEEIPASWREVVVLRYLQGLSSQETAEKLDTSVERVHVNLSRGLARLRQLLGSQ